MGSRARWKVRLGEADRSALAGLPGSIADAARRAVADLSASKRTAAPPGGYAADDPGPGQSPACLFLSAAELNELDVIAAAFNLTSRAAAFRLAVRDAAYRSGVSRPQKPGGA